MEYIRYLWGVTPFSLSALVAVILALSSAVRAHDRSMRWFIFGTAGNLLWALGFACAAATRAAPTIFVREVLREYIDAAFLVGSLLLCVFSLIYLSRNIVILGQTTEKKQDGTGEQYANASDHDKE